MNASVCTSLKRSLFDDLLALATESMESAREFWTFCSVTPQPGIVAFNAFNFSLAERALQNASRWGITSSIEPMYVWPRIPFGCRLIFIKSDGGVLNEHGLANARPWTNQILIKT